MKKGLVFSLGTMLIASSILLFAVFYAQKVQTEENSIYKNFETEKAGFAAEDITSDINSILEAQIDANRSQTDLSITFFDQLPPKTAKSELTDYNSFVFNKYSAQQNAAIAMNIDRLVDGKTELVFSNGLQYDYDYSGSQNSVMFYLPEGNTNADSFDANIFVSGAQFDGANSAPWSCSGSGKPVNLNFSDSFGSTISSSCLHSPLLFSEYSFAFIGESGTLSVQYGGIGVNQNALKIQSTLSNTGISAKTAIKTILPPLATEIKWSYDADLNYSQGGTNISRKIEIGRS